MPTNDFLPFAVDVNAGVMSQADYAERAGLGVMPGIADPDFANKAWRQGANMAAALGRIAAARGYDALDNGDLNALQSSLDDTISVGTFNRVYFSQSSGSYTAPRTGVYRITLKGGGGGGGGRDSNSANSSGTGGGESGTLIFYVTLVKNTSYAYTIGAGGVAGNTGPGTATGGGTGGASNFASTYSVSGGFGGTPSQNQGKYGGAGGKSYAVPTGETGYFIPGAPGMTIGLVANGGAGFSAPAVGGGNGGGNGSEAARYGGGGSGASPIYSGTDATAGGDGYILIEYAG